MKIKRGSTYIQPHQMVPLEQNTKFFRFKQKVMTCNPLSWEFSLVSFRYTLYILRRNQFLRLDCLVCACVFCNCNSRCRVPPFPISLLKPKEMEILIYQYIEIPKIRNCKKKMWQQDFFDAGGDENLLIFFVSPYSFIF